MIQLDLESTVWKRFVRSRRDALPFHHPSWTSLLADCYGFRAFALALTDSSDSGVIAGLPVLEARSRLHRRPRWMSLPFTDICPPLVDEHIAPRLIVALDQARREAGVGRLEVRALVGGAPPSDAIAFRHTLQLEGTAEQVARRCFRPAVNRNVRAAKRTGLMLRRADCEADLDSIFYELQVNTRRRHGLPVQPRRFFRLLWRRILEPGLGFALFVCNDNKPVAGAVFLTWNRTMTYKYGASDPAFWHLRPNNLLFWEAISWGCDHGYELLDFGRTDFDGAGLRRFKLGWGCREQELRYTVLGGNAAGSHGTARALLRPVLRRSPPWVVRALGSFLYRQAA